MHDEERDILAKHDIRKFMEEKTERFQNGGLIEPLPEISNIVVNVYFVEELFSRSHLQ